MGLLVVSDLHVWGADDPLYRALNLLISERAKSGDTLVLAGDVFDVFVGKKDVFVSEYRDFITVVNEAARKGVKVHYIEGNHDFFLRGVFTQEVHVHRESVALALGEKRFLVAHGDLADKKDYSYRALRTVLRSVPFKAAVKLTPGKLVRGIGTRSSRYSRSRSPRNPVELPIERRERLRTVYRSYAAEKLAEGYDFVVMGHCHDLDEKVFKIGSRVGQYINVGYPRAHGSYLSWNVGEEKITREKLPD